MGIRSTLKNACKKVFSDASATMDQRLKRAEAVRIIGREFMAIGKVVGKTKKDEAVTMESIKARAEVAVMTTMAKAQGQEVSEDDTEELIRQHKQMAADRTKATEVAEAAEMPKSEIPTPPLRSRKQ